jgi:uncharacterized metal-binding protein YceD (DUF177 family)
MLPSYFKKYEIEIFQLQSKKYFYTFEVEKEFFENYEGSLTSNGQVRADVMLHKINNMFHFEVKLVGWIELVCDRSLELYKQEINTTEKFIYRYDEKEGEIDLGLYGVKNGSLTINLTDRIYEGIAVQIPYRKIHPKFKNDFEEFGSVDENDISLFYTSKSDETSNQDIDPRWQTLLKLLNNKN